MTEMRDITVSNHPVNGWLNFYRVSQRLNTVYKVSTWDLFLLLESKRNPSVSYTSGKENG